MTEHLRLDDSYPRATRPCVCGDPACGLARIPDYFCWTRFGAEAGQAVAEILARKERDRRANGGLFLWGIGNAIGPGMRELVCRTSDPQVLFSPIKGRPRGIDSAPPRVVAWTQAETIDGRRYQLPSGSVVTSRLDALNPKGCHYALVCHSAEPLEPDNSRHRIDFTQVANLTTGNPLGASQVTAVVGLRAYDGSCGNEYVVAWRARLVAPHFIRLRVPVAIDLSSMLDTCGSD